MARHEILLHDPVIIAELEDRFQLRVGQGQLRNDPPAIVISDDSITISLRFNMARETRDEIIKKASDLTR